MFKDFISCSLEIWVVLWGTALCFLGIFLLLPRHFPTTFKDFIHCFLAFSHYFLGICSAASSHSWGENSVSHFLLCWHVLPVLVVSRLTAHTICEQVKQTNETGRWCGEKNVAALTPSPMIITWLLLQFLSVLWQSWDLRRNFYMFKKLIFFPVD